MNKAPGARNVVKHQEPSVKKRAGAGDWSCEFRASLLLGAWCLVLFTGCQSGSENVRADVDSLAFIEVRGHRALDVARTVSLAFKEAGFAAVPLPPNTSGMQMLFEKQASTTDTVIFGDWSGKVWLRAKIRIETPDANVQLVKCDVYRVVGHGDKRFEEESRVYRKGPYQELLDKVKKQLTGQ